MQLVRSLMRCLNDLVYFLTITTTVFLPVLFVAVTVAAANGQNVQASSDLSSNDPSAFLLPDIFHINSIRTTRLRDQSMSNILVEFRRVHQDPWDEGEEWEYGRRLGSVPSMKVHCEISWEGSYRPKNSNYTDCINDRLLNHDEASPSSMFKLRVLNFSSLRNFTLEVQEVRVGAGSKKFTANVKPPGMEILTAPGSSITIYQTEFQVPRLRGSDWGL